MMLTVRVPLAIQKRGGRKMVLAPDGVTYVPQHRGTHRQHAGEGAGAGVPVAAAVGERAVRDHRRMCTAEKITSLQVRT